MKVQKRPLDPESVRQMHHLWLAAFGNDFVSDVPDDVLYGEENRWNRTNIYTIVHLSIKLTFSLENFQLFFLIFLYQLSYKKIVYEYFLPYS